MTDTFAPETRLRARVPPQIDRVTPDSIAVAIDQDITIDGFGLYPTSSVRLIQPEKPEVFCTVLSSSPDGKRIVARVAANTASIGVWSVRVSVLGGNLLTAQQSSLEFGTSAGWISNEPAITTLGATDVDAIDGRYSLALTTSEPGFQGLSADTLPIPVVPGQGYVVSGWAKAFPSRDSHEFMGVQLTGRTSTGARVFLAQGEYPIQDDWAQASSVRLVPSASIVSVCVSAAVSNAFAGKQYLWDLLYLTQDTPVDITSTQTISVEDRRTPTSIVAMTGNGQTTGILQPFPINMTALVTDVDDNPLPNRLVRFQAPTGLGPSGVWGGGINVEDILTDDVGIANAGQFIANNRAGAYFVTANMAVSPLPFAAGFGHTNTPQPPSTIQIFAGAGQIADVGDTYPNPFVIRIVDPHDNDISGVEVTLIVQPGPQGTFANGTGTAKATTVNGYATFEPFTAGAQPGSIVIWAYTATLGPVGWIVTAVLGPPAIITIRSGDNQTMPVNNQFPQSLSVRVTDKMGNATPNVTVRFLGPFSGAGCLWGFNTFDDKPTNVLGDALADAVRANTIAGSYQVRADVLAQPVNQPALFNLTNVPGPVDLLVASRGTPQSTAISTAFREPLQAKATDAYGNPVSGIAVTFGIPGNVGVASGQFPFGNQDHQVTALDGTATAGTLTANDITGSFIATATMPTGLAKVADFLLTNLLRRDATWEEFGEYEFVNAKGEGQKLFVLRGQHGRLMPIVELSEDTVPEVPGFRFLGARHAAREIVLPCVVEAPLGSGREMLRQLARVLDPTLGIGSLRIQLDDGSMREIGAVYVGGLEQAVQDNPNVLHVPLIFRAPDPYWVDGILHIDQAGSFDDQINIVNDGDYETWPVIHSVGAAPIYGLTLRNMANQLVISFTGNGRDILIDCRPGHRTVTIDGIRNYQSLTRDSELWPLKVGANSIWISTTLNRGTTTFTWARRYLSV